MRQNQWGFTLTLEKLETFYDRIIESNVILSLEHNNTQVKDKSAVIKLRIPGTVLVAKEISKSFEESTDKAVDHLRVSDIDPATLPAWQAEAIRD